MHLRLVTAFVAALAGCGALAVLAFAGRGDDSRSVKVTVRDDDGRSVGTVRLTERRAGRSVDVRASLRNLRPGFHGFHIHAVGSCERPSFQSAAGHLKRDGQTHGDHVGDLPPLLVKRNGTATLRVTTDRFALDDLRDDDGSAVLVHAGPDNFANVPPRYAPNGPDQETLDTGDSGARVACGEIARRR